MNVKFNYGFLRIVSGMILLAGAVSSLALMFSEGRNQKSIILIMMFSVWVFSPFFALLVANTRSRHLARRTHTTYYLLAFFITLGSLVIYSGGWNMPGAKPAFKYLVVPFISWLLIAIFIVAPILKKRKSFRV
ncbi:MAG: hypothetical protein ACHQET_13655 [Chitinophagales bacterium]